MMSISSGHLASSENLRWFGCVVALLILIALTRIGHFKTLLRTCSSTCGRIVQRRLPALKTILVGLGWTCLGMISSTIIIWVVKKISYWCRQTVFRFSGEGVRGHYAFTIDDAPGRGNPFMHEVLDLLKTNQAKCTFFIISSQVHGREELLRRCILDGHELANHGVDDIAYHHHTEEEFRAALNQCQQTIEKSYASVPPQDVPASPAPRVKWFRPPHARCSATMTRVLEQEGYTLALCDCYGMDTICSGDYVASHILSKAAAGSVVLMHMPERGFREHNLAAIARVLEGLARRGLRGTTLSEMYAMAAG